jgi:hypothetical protein
MALYHPPPPLSPTEWLLTPCPPPPPSTPSLPQASFFSRCVAIAKAHRAACEAKGLKKVAEFRGSLSDKEDATWPAELGPLRKEVIAFARSFPVVGFDSCKY